MTSSIRLALSLALSLAIVPAAYAAPPTKTGKTDKGNVLTDAKGMTLYTFDKDADGKSACKRTVCDKLARAEGRGERCRGRRLHRHHARRRIQAVGLQGQAALHLRQGPEARRHHRRRLFERRLASGDAVSGQSAAGTRGGV